MLRRTVFALIGLAATTGAWFAVGPAQFGGPATYVVTNGDSMEPQIHGGDLIIVRRGDHFRVGDVVAYRNHQLRRVVVHRIAKRQGDRFLMKGDNNSWLDSASPSAADIMGRPWLRVPSVGRAVAGLAVPRNAGLLAGAAILLGLGGSGVQRRRRRVRLAQPRRPVEPAGAPTPLASAPSRNPLARRIAVVCAAVGLVGVGVAAFAAVQPETRTVRHQLPHTHQGVFSYAGAVERGPVYPSGRLATGDPVFLTLVPALDVRFAYQMTGADLTGLSGHARLDLVVSDDGGWSRTVTLQPDAPFRGKRVVLPGRLDLAGLHALLKQVQESTGVAKPTYQLALRPHVVIDGASAGLPVHGDFRPELGFTLDNFALRMNQPTAGQVADPLHPRASGSVSRVGSEPWRLVVAGHPLNLSTARVPATAAGVALLLLAGLLWLRSRSAAEIDEAASIEARFGRWIVPVRRLPDTEAVVELSSFDGLVRLAEQFEQLVLHAHHYGGHVFAVHVHGVTYRYDVGTTRVDLIRAAVEHLGAERLDPDTAARAAAPTPMGASAGPSRPAIDPRPADAVEVRRSGRTGLPASFSPATIARLQ